MKYEIIMYVLDYIIGQCILDIVNREFDDMIKYAATHKDLFENMVY